jgi:hypothetical protein
LLSRSLRPAHVPSDATGNKSQSLNFRADSGARIEIS